MHYSLGTVYGLGHWRAIYTSYFRQATSGTIGCLADAPNVARLLSCEDECIDLVHGQFFHEREDDVFKEMRAFLQSN